MASKKAEDQGHYLMLKKQPWKELHLRRITDSLLQGGVILNTENIYLP